MGKKIVTWLDELQVDALTLCHYFDLPEYESLLRNALILGSSQLALLYKLHRGIRCYQDHGAGYTVRRVLYHMGLWEDEEKD